MLYIQQARNVDQWFIMPNFQWYSIKKNELSIQSLSCFILRHIFSVSFIVGAFLLPMMVYSNKIQYILQRKKSWKNANNVSETLPVKIGNPHNYWDSV
jgi:hypothetical protein